MAYFDDPNLDPYYADPFGYGAPPADPFSQRPRAPIQPIAPQDENSAIMSVVKAPLGALQYLGETLNKGGRAVRGLLGGQGPEALLNLVPFSDTMGLTDPHKSVSGKDLLGQWGLINPNEDSWLNTGLGIGADIATDPLTYLTFGGSALTEAGQAANKLGALRNVGFLNKLRGVSDWSPYAKKAADLFGNGDELAALAGKPLQNLVNLHVPFVGDLGGIGAGAGTADALQSAGNLLGKVPGLKTAYDWTVDPAMRKMAQMFDPAVNGTFEAGTQAAQRDAYAMKELKNYETNLWKNQFQDKLAAAGDPMGEGLRAFGEGRVAGPLRPDDQFLLDFMQPGGQLGPLRPNADYSPTAQLFKEYKDRIGGLRNDALNAGVPIEDMAYHMPRHWTEVLRDPNVGTGRSPVTNAVNNTLNAREDFLRAPTDVIQALSKDTDVLARTPEGMAKIRQALEPFANPADAAKVLPGLPQDISASAATEALLNDRTARFADWAGGLPAKAKDTGIFGNPLAQDMGINELGLNKATTNAEAISRMIAENAAPAAGQGAVSIREALRQSGLTDNAMARVAEMMGPRATPERLADMFVPAGVMSDINAVRQPFQLPNAVNDLLAPFDKATQAFKSGVTGIWPSFLTRRGVGHVVNDLDALGGTAVRSANELASGGVSTGAKALLKGAGLGQFASDAEASKALANLQAASGIGGVSSRYIEDPLQAMMAGKVGEVPLGVGDILSRAASNFSERDPGVWNAIKAAASAPMEVGSNLNAKISAAATGSAFQKAIEQGYTPYAAGELAKKLNYVRDSTDFERQVMQRLAPFYNFSRASIPQSLETLAQRPGGLISQFVRESANLRSDPKQFVPDYLANDLSLPLGSEKDGTQRYLTRLGLPIEHALGLVSTGPGGVGKTMEHVLGMLNPAIKGPLEYATGKQFYSGRDLADLYSQTGMPALDQLLANTPLSKATTTVRQLADPRKYEGDWLTALGTQALNLGTGAKVSDVDLQKARDKAVLDRIKQVTQGHEGVSKFESLYVKPENVDKLTPEDVLLLRLNRSLEERMKKRKGSG